MGQYLTIGIATHIVADKERAERAIREHRRFQVGIREGVQRKQHLSDERNRHGYCI